MTFKDNSKRYLSIATGAIVVAVRPGRVSGWRAGIPAPGALCTPERL